MKQLANTKLLESLRDLDLSHNKNIDDTIVELFYSIIAKAIQTRLRKYKVKN